jgi:hypothetical protein
MISRPVTAHPEHANSFGCASTIPSYPETHRHARMHHVSNFVVPRLCNKSLLALHLYPASDSKLETLSFVPCVCSMTLEVISLYPVSSKFPVNVIQTVPCGCGLCMLVGGVHHSYG